MGVRISCWQPDKPGIPPRWYVQGLDIDAKVWFEPARRQPENADIKIDGHAEGWNVTSILREVRRVLGVADGVPVTIPILAAHAPPVPPQAPPADRRNEPADTARRSPDNRGAARPGRWQGREGAGLRQQARPQTAPITEDDADALDPSVMRSPLPAPTTLYVDRREPADIINLLRQIRNLELELVQLDLGQFLVPGKLIVGRRTAGDFKARIADERKMFWETAQISALNFASLLILEGDIYADRGMALNSLLGSLSFVACIQGLSILPSLTHRQSGYMIVKAIRHACYGPGAEVPLRQAGPKDPQQAARYVLEGIPGLSAARALKLLTHFGSVAAIAAATKEEILSVPGIDPATVQQVVATMHARFQQPGAGRTAIEQAPEL